MKAFLFSFCYNILYTVGWLVTLPSYLRSAQTGTLLEVNNSSLHPITGSRKGCCMCMP